MSTESTTRWWWGVAAVSVLVIFLYLLAFAVLSIQGTPTASLPALVLDAFGAFGVFVVDLVVLLLTVLFSVSLLMDVRAIRKSSAAWSPSTAYTILAVIHLLNLFLPILWLFISIPGAALYLYRRHTHLGVP